MIKISNLSKKFNDTFVLKDINLNIKKNTIVGIIGRNGSGKTVLLKIIAGLYFPTEGEIIIDKSLNIHDNFGFLIDTGFIDSETGFNNLYNLSLIKNKISKEDICRVLDYVGLDPFSKIKYINYSTGMKQKLKIAQAIMENPDVLILDEPFNGLDKQSVEYFRKEFLKMKEDGKTIILTSHYQEDINALCDEVYEINEGVMKNYESKS